jgi:hypothetical protein
VNAVYGIELTQFIVEGCQIANSLTECGHETFKISEFWANDGQSFPYPSLVVRARNGRVADHPELTIWV